MARKVSNKQLLLLFVVLLAIVAGIQIWQSQSEDKGTLKGELIKPLDSAAVNKLVIVHEFDTNQRVTLVKRKDGWQLASGGKGINQKRLERALDDLFHELEADRLVSRNKKDWNEYGVDSSGSLLKIYQDGKLHDELIIGETDFKNQSTATTYVRNKNDNSVYSVEAYLKGSLKGKRSEWVAGGDKRQGPSPRMKQKIMQQRMKQLRDKNVNLDSLKKKLKQQTP